MRWTRYSLISWVKCVHWPMYSLDSMYIGQYTHLTVTKIWCKFIFHLVQWYYSGHGKDILEIYVRGFVQYLKRRDFERRNAQKCMSSFGCTFSAFFGFWVFFPLVPPWKLWKKKLLKKAVLKISKNLVEKKKKTQPNEPIGLFVYFPFQKDQETTYSIFILTLQPGLT